jgi:hypothetical protein
LRAAAAENPNLPGRKDYLSLYYSIVEIIVEDAFTLRKATSPIAEQRV